jgi:hypothetical protein
VSPFPFTILQQLSVVESELKVSKNGVGNALQVVLKVNGPIH